MSIHQDEFFQQVADALKHLYDYPYLERHPLALRCWPGIRQAGPSRAQRLSRLLLESIEALNPPTGSSRDTSRAQFYSLLVHRYVEEWPLKDIMRELGYSRRQFFREQRKAIAMLAVLLWEKLPSSEPPSAALEAGEEDWHEKVPRQETLAAEPGDLLDAEVERFLAQREAVDVVQVVRGVLQVVVHLADQHGVTLKSDFAPRLPPIYTNRTLLRQVFLKALTNLITQPGSQHVDLQIRSRGQQVVAELTSRSHTPGSPPDDSADHQMPDAEPVRRMVEMVGGNWHGVKRGPAGCTCRFSFPADSEKVLLVIEDNEAVIRAFRRYLAGYNYQVVGATTGTEALRLAREVSPTAITLDIMIPSQDGWEILQELKDDPVTQHIPVIICSVLENPELARSLGAADYLRKPVAQSDLLDALDGLSVEPDPRA